MSKTTQASIVFRTDGTGRGLYTEVIDLTRLGRLRVERATTIEFDNRLQAWRVKDRTGFPLFTSPSREECLDWERRYFNSNPPSPLAHSAVVASATKAG